MADERFRRRLEELLIRDFGTADVGAVPLPGLDELTGTRVAKDESRLEPSSWPPEPAYDPLTSVRPPNAFPKLSEIAAPADDDYDPLSSISTGIGRIPSLDEISAPAPDGYLDTLTNALGRGINRAQQGLAVIGNEAGFMTNEELAKNLRRDELDIASYPKSLDEEQAMADYQAAEGTWDSVKAAVTNPFDLAVTVMAESLPQAVPSMVGGALGATAGTASLGPGLGTTAGYTGGMFLGGIAPEYASSLLDIMQEDGIDIGDEAAVVKAFNDPILMARAKAKALRRGIAVSGFDALTSLFGGKLYNILARRGVNKPMTALLLGATESTGGATGELAGQIAADGKVTDWKAAGLEAIAEVPGVVTDTGGAILADTLSKPGAPPAPGAPPQQPPAAGPGAPVPPPVTPPAAPPQAAPVVPPPGPGAPSPITGAPVGAGATSAPVPPAVVAPASAPPLGSVTPEQRATLRKMGYPDEDIDALAPEQAAQELEDAASDGVTVTPDEIAAAGTYRQPPPTFVPNGNEDDERGLPLDSRDDPVVGDTEDSGSLPGLPPADSLELPGGDGGVRFGDVPVRPNAPVGGSPVGRPDGAMAPDAPRGGPAGPVPADLKPVPEPAPDTFEDIEDSDFDMLPTDPESEISRLTRAGVDPERAGRLAAGVLTDDEGNDITLNPEEERRYFEVAAGDIRKRKEEVAGRREAEGKPPIPPRAPVDPFDAAFDEAQADADARPATTGDGSRNRPARVTTEADLGPARERVDEPTDAQAVAGNYRKGHAVVEGMSISVETPKGATRRSKDPNNPWEAVSPADYGYFKGTKGADGDHLDVYIGPNPGNGKAFVVDQYDPKTGKFDEHKVFLGVEDEAEATALYDASFSDGSGPTRRGGVKAMSTDDLRGRLAVRKGLGRRPVGGPRPSPAPAQPAAAAAPAPEAMDPIKKMGPRVSRAREGKDGIIRKPNGDPVKPARLWRWVAGIGGIKDPTGELRRRDFTKYPGLINNRTGRTLDNAREAAAEAGFFGLPESQYMDTTTVADFLNLLDQDMSSGPDGGVFSHDSFEQLRAWREWKEKATGRNDEEASDEWEAHREAVSRRVDEYEQTTGDPLPLGVRKQLVPLLALDFEERGADAITDEDIDTAVDGIIREMEREQANATTPEEFEELARDMDIFDPGWGEEMRRQREAESQTGEPVDLPGWDDEGTDVEGPREPVEGLRPQGEGRPEGEGARGSAPVDGAPQAAEGAGGGQVTPPRTENVPGVGPQGLLFSGKDELATPPKMRPQGQQADTDFGLFAKPKAKEPEQLDIETAAKAPKPEPKPDPLLDPALDGPNSDFKRDPKGAPLGQQLRDYVWKKGGTKYEVMAAVDKDGRIVLNKDGGKDRVAFFLNDEIALFNAEQVVLHHNHPNLTSLSPDDIAFLAVMGGADSVIQAHHGEFSYRARLTPEAVRRLEKIVPPPTEARPYGAAIIRRNDAAHKKLMKVADEARKVVADESRRRWRSGDTAFRDRTLGPSVKGKHPIIRPYAEAIEDLAVEMLYRAGIIDYATNRVPEYDAYSEMPAVVEAFIERAAREFQTQIRPRREISDRSTLDGGLPGEVGILSQGDGEPVADAAGPAVDQGGEAAARGDVDPFDAAFDAAQQDSDAAADPNYDPTLDPASDQYDAEADRARERAERERAKQREAEILARTKAKYEPISQAIIDAVKGGREFIVPGIAGGYKAHRYGPASADLLRVSPRSGLLQTARGRGKWDELFSTQVDEIARALGLTAAPAAPDPTPAAPKTPDAAFDELAALFGAKPKSVSQSPVDATDFDHERYAQILPILRKAAEAFPDLKSDPPALVGAMVRRLRENYTREAVEGLRPYMRRWYDDLTSGRETVDGEPNDSSSSPDLESDLNRTPANGDGAATVPSAGGPDGGAARPGPGANEGDGSGPAGSGGVPDSRPAPMGTRSDPGERRRPADRGVSPGGRQSDDPGLPDDREPADGTDEDALGRPGLTEPDARAKAQARGDRTPVRPGDRDNISKTLPLLLPEQQDDVEKAEKRFAAGHFGMLFTNGTGTGKTYTGAGIVKRYHRQGKKNVLVIAPNNDILLGWQKALADLAVPSELLPDTKTAGSGVTLTTFNNLMVNPELARRQFDHVVVDEAHMLMQAGTNEVPDWLSALRGVTRKPGSQRDLAHARHREVVRELRTLQGKRKRTPADDMRIGDLESIINAEYQKIEQTWGKEPRSTVTFLSATPFAYPENLDYAEGYLFDFPEENKNTVGSYNHLSGRDRFYVENFGYRKKYGKLTKPAHHTRLADMLVMFQEKLTKEGALSGRELDIESDYERRFVEVDDASGRSIDKLMTAMWEIERYRDFLKPVRERFNYLQRMRLLEAIKAKHAIDRSREHMKLGRKVVVFHNYIEGGGFDPFDLSFAEGDTVITGRDEGGSVISEPAEAVWAEFRARFPEIEKLNFEGLGSPIEQFKEAFGDELLLYNGRVSKKNRTEAIRTFNTDGKPAVILVQADAGEKGISLHDVTGKHTRVLMNLGLPAKPTQAIQEEGRIYRVGQHPDSDSLYEYFTTGTAWERMAFAQKLAERSDAVEKLALGPKARGLRDSFVDAFNDPTDVKPADTDGRGGKAKDRNYTTVSPFDRAVAYFRQRLKNNKRRNQREGVDYYATPEPLGFKMVEWAQPRHGDKILEPSAGHGAISRFFPDFTDKTIVEPSPDLIAEAALNTDGARAEQTRFEDLDPVNKFDVIVMNPPFGRAGKTAMEHVEKAWGHLREGGRLVALLPSSSWDAAHELSRDAPGAVYRNTLSFHPVVFENAGTSVKTFVIIIDKVDRTKPGHDQAVKDAIASSLQNQQTRYQGRTDSSIEEFFEAIRDIQGPERPELPPPPPAFEDRIYEVGGFSFKGDTGKRGAAPSLKPRGRLESKFQPMRERAAEFGGFYVRGDGLFRFPNGDQAMNFLASLSDRPLEVAPAPAADTPNTMAVSLLDNRTGRTQPAVILPKRVGRTEWSYLNERARFDFGGSYVKGGQGANFSAVGSADTAWHGGWSFRDEGSRNAFMSWVDAEVARGAVKIGQSRIEFEDILADAAEYAVWKPERIDREIAENGYTMDDRTKAWVGWVNPLDFVAATTDSTSRPIIERETGRLNRASLEKEPTSPVVGIDENGKIISHEGRHRMQAMAMEGVQRAPVVVFSYGKGTPKQPQPSMPLRGQYEAGKRKDWQGNAVTPSADIVVTNLIPLHYKFRSQIDDAMKGDRTPLVSFSPAQRGTPAFKAWFGKSKILDGDGEPRVMYHQTAADFDYFEFQGEPRWSGSSGYAFWLTSDPESIPAGHNTSGSGDQQYRTGTNIMPVYAKAENLLYMDHDDPTGRQEIRDRFAGGSKEFPRLMTHEWRDAVLAAGYDGIWFTYDEGGGKVRDELVVFQREQIKSAIGNRGTFDPNEPRITASPERPPQTGPVLSDEDSDILGGVIEDVLRDMLPDNVGIRFTNQSIRSAGATNGWGFEVAYASGTYEWSRQLITVALSEEDALNTAVHEAGHAFQHLMTDQERAVMKAEGARLRDFIRNHPRTRVTESEVAGMKPVEIEAEAFALYWMDRAVGAPSGAGLHLIIRRAWERTIRILTRIRNGLRGLGYQNATDVFERARTGGMRDRRANRVNDEQADYLFGEEDQSAGRVSEMARRPGRQPPGTQALPGVPTNAQQAAANAAASMNQQINLPVIPTPQQQQQANQAMVTRNRRHFSSVEGWLDKARIKVQDRFLAVRRDQERVARAGMTVLPSMDTAQAESMFPGRAGSRIGQIESRHVTPLVEFLKRAKITLEELDGFLKARHVPERNALIATRTAGNPGGPILDGSGHTDAWAAAEMARIAADPRYADFLAAAAKVDALIEETLVRKYQSGLITRDEYDDLRLKFQYYVPLKGWEADPELAADQQTGAGRGFDIRGPEHRAAMGRQSVADSPLAYAIMDAQTSVIRSEKNRVLKVFSRYVEQVNDPTRYEKVRGQYRQRINKTTGLIERYFVPAIAVREREIVSVKIGGREVHYRVKDRDMLRALQTVGSVEMNSLLRMMMTVSRFYAQLQTQFNPQFVVTNFPRDVETALLNISDVENLPPDTRKRILKEVPKAVPGIFKALREARKSGQPPSGRIGAYFEEFQLEGGQVSFGMIDPVENIKKKLADAMDPSLWTKFKGNPVFQTIMDANESVENGVRLAVYIALREAAVPKAKAASVAREVTTNFNRRGEWGPAINSLYIFFNASLQGTVRMMQALRKSRTVQVSVVAMIGAGLAMDMINTLIAESFGGDDEEKRAYDDIPDAVKQRNFIVMLPGTKEYLKIPLAFGYNWFWNTGRVMSQTMQGKLAPLESAKQLVLTGVDAFNPMGAAPSFAQYLAPTIADPFVQIGENRNFFGGPIQPTSFDKATPQSQLAFDSVGEPYRWFAEGLNSITGGSAGRPGVIDISPESFEHLVEFATGGAGRFITNALKSGASATGLSSREWLPEQTPILNVFYGSAGTTQAQRDIFYRTWERVDQANHEVTELKKRGERELLNQRRQEFAAELRSYDAFAKARKELTDLRRRKSMLRERLSGAELQKRIDQIEERERQVIHQAMRRLERVEEAME